MPWDRNQGLLVAALHWKWKVEYGLKIGRRRGSDYLEVHFEDLVVRPQPTLARISAFIAQELNASQIHKRSVGTLTKPNSTFHQEVAENRFQPVERWRRYLGAQELKTVEFAIAPLLQELDYALSSEPARASVQHRIARTLYPKFFGAKRWLKFHTIFGRITSVKRLQFTE